MVTVRCVGASLTDGARDNAPVTSAVRNPYWTSVLASIGITAGVRTDDLRDGAKLDRLGFGAQSVHTTLSGE